MCGIAGIVGQGWPVAGVSTDEMAKSLRHRGPDDYGILSDSYVHLVHTRLAIIDTSDRGRQPMQRGPLTLTYNGEIFNFKALKETLNGPWQSETDSEVLLALWERHGEACLPMLDGQFAFGLYDGRSRVLTLARDRAGEKPLYYTFQNGTFAFASELKALTNIPGLSWEIDQDAFGAFMALRYVPAPMSIVKNVYKLEPGHVLTFDGTTVKTKRWYAWEVNPITGYSQEHFKRTVDQVEEALIESVRTRLIADRPLGMFLSGGIDSSLVCAIAAKLGHTPKTFSIGFEGDDKSEHERARKTANILGAEHHERIFGTAEFERVALSIGASQDEPNGDRSCVPTYLLSEFARSECVVALSGDGADELFGGYGRYFGPCETAVDYYDRLLPVGGTAWCPAEAARFEHLFAYPLRDTIHARRQLDFHRYLACVLAKVDRMSMQHGLEVRTPYLSPDLLSIASQLPTKYLINGGMGKLILRELAAKYIDRELASLPKVGFGMPKSVFDGNSLSIKEEMSDALAIMQNMTFQPNWHVLPGTANSTWAIIVFAQWANSFPVKL